MIPACIGAMSCEVMWRAALGKCAARPLARQVELQWRLAAQAPGLVRSVVELPLATTVDRGCCAVVEAVACSGRVRSRVVGAVARIMPRRWEWPHEGVGEDAGRRDPVFVKTAAPETWRGTLTGCVS